jgi:hypothetical protein
MQGSRKFHGVFCHFQHFFVEILKKLWSFRHCKQPLYSISIVYFFDAIVIIFSLWLILSFHLFGRNMIIKIGISRKGHDCSLMATW